MIKDKKFKFFYLVIVIVITALIILSDDIYYYYSCDAQFFLGIFLVTIALGVFLYHIKSDFLNPISIYSVFWLGIAGISTFRISYYQEKWSLYMWIIIIISYATFLLGFKIFNMKNIDIDINNRKICRINEKKLYLSIKIITILSLIGFTLEVAILKYIPLFSKNMEAYRAFNITGIHYFVVSVGIIPTLTLLYKKIGGTKRVFLYNFISFLISILILSRQLIIMQIVLVTISYHYTIKKISLKKLGIFLIIGLILFSLSFRLRNQSSQYINKVADIMPKYQSSMFVKPLLYFNMNFTNLNIIVNKFHDYKMGQNMIFPIVAFTGLKNEFNYNYKENYLATKNFNTSTYLADIYFDFGIFGVIIIPFILGVIYSFLYRNMKKNLSIINLIYFLLIYCLIFCFFVNWYYNTAIIFDIILIFIIYSYSEKNSVIK